LHNVRLADLVDLMQGFGFAEARTAGSHHLFVHPDLDELVNVQDVRGEAKPYQIRQFLRLVERYNLQLGDRE
jgi:predicted RNA binding protein YcfA (HicA-like mRNA interferase family)